jgi:hypothetical protein
VKVSNQEMNISTRYQASWVSKARRDELKRRTIPSDIMLLDSLHGPLLIEPEGSDLGDGARLIDGDADAELRAVWCLERKTKIAHARRLLGLAAEEAAPWPMAARV